MARCKLCEQEILWVRTEEGKNLSVEAGGATTVVAAGGKVVRGYVLHAGRCQKRGSSQSRFPQAPSLFYLQRMALACSD